MKKSLIALLVATLPAAAFADVTIYGKIKGGVEYVDNGTNKKTNIDDLGSRIGFKGAEDLGSGLKAIWQVETGFGIDGQSRTGSSSGTFANRNSFVGLQSNLGTLRLGNVSNFMDSDMGTVDVWEYSDNSLGLGLFTRDGNRLKNSVRYDLPSAVPGLTAALQYGAKENKAGTIDTTTNKLNTDREVYSLGLGYENSGFFGKYSFQREGTAVTEGVKALRNDKHRLEVGYNANNLYVGLGYQQEQGDDSIVWSNTGFSYARPATAVASDKVKTQEIALTATYTFGAITPKFSYVKGKDVKVGGQTVADTGYDQYVLGADYAISKRTTIGAQYGELDFKGANKDQKAFGLNMVHAF
ncbi:porin [Chromobacterium subtsugae]|uniref:porin n=1 Tax=Chromobacterium subtsugae TaxID=251747 RepID=UPI000640C220|nr:porin [Chromobacterium subtsugae]